MGEPAGTDATPTGVRSDGPPGGAATGDRGDQVTLLGVRIDNIDCAEALRRIEVFVRRREPVLVVTPNVDVLMTLQRDAEYMRIYRQSALVLTDGVPLLWAARFLGTPIREKLSGSDLFHSICALSARQGFRVAFVGGRPGAAERAGAVMRERHAGLQIAAIHCPPMGFENDPEASAVLDAVLTESRPDILFLGLGSPKQEKWFDRNARRLGVPVTIGIGITFEYTCGMVRRAPRWMQRIGLEWFFRLLSEPRRLWRRYLLQDPAFFWLVLRQRFRT